MDVLRSVGHSRHGLEIGSAECFRERIKVLRVHARQTRQVWSVSRELPVGFGMVPGAFPDWAIVEHPSGGHHSAAGKKVAANRSVETGYPSHVCAIG